MLRVSLPKIRKRASLLFVSVCLFESVKVKSLSHAQLFVTIWTTARLLQPWVGFPKQEYWRGLPFPSPGGFLIQGSNPGLPHCRQTLDRFGTVGLHCCMRAFASCGAWASHGGGLSRGAQAACTQASAVVVHGLISCSSARGAFLEQTLHLCPLHWQLHSEPLSHQGRLRQCLCNRCLDIVYLSDIKPRTCLCLKSFSP